MGLFKPGWQISSPAGLHPVSCPLATMREILVITQMATRMMQFWTLSLQSLSINVIINDYDIINLTKQ